MDESQIDKAEQLLGYFEQHGEAMTYGPEAVRREWWMGDAANLLRDMLPEWSAYREDERLVVIIEVDTDHMEHMWSDVERGWQERDRVQEEADNIDAGTWTPYGVTTAKVCTCCGHVTEQYVSALWGCVVEGPDQSGRYELDNLDAITDDYLREVAQEVIAEALV